MYTFNTDTLANGLKVGVIEMPHVHSVEMAIYFKVGSVNDPEGKEGLTHFLEHMMFNGTKTLPNPLDLEIAFEKIGGDPNAETGKESMGFYSRVHPKYIEQGLSLLSDLIQKPLFKSFSREKSVIVQEAQDELDENGQNINPSSIANSMMWPNCNLGNPIIGFESTIKSIRISDIKSHYGKFIVPENAVLVVVGNVSKNDVLTIIKERFGNWKNGSIKIKRPRHQIKKKKTFGYRYVKNLGSNQLDVCITFPAINRCHNASMLSWALRGILCSGTTSRMFRNLRTENGYVYDINGFFETYTHEGIFSFEFSTIEKNLINSILEILKEISRIKTEPVSQEEIEMVKNSVIMEFDFSLDIEAILLEKLAFGLLFGKLRTFEEEKKRISKVTKKDILELSAKCFEKNQMNIVIVGNMKTKTEKKLKQSIEKIVF